MDDKEVLSFIPKNKSSLHLAVMTLNSKSVLSLSILVVAAAAVSVYND